MREVIEESGLYDFFLIEYLAEAIAHYHNKLKKINRAAKATCFLIVLKSSDVREVKLEAHEKFTLDWVTAEELAVHWMNRNKDKDYDHWLWFLAEAVERSRKLGYTVV